MSNYLILNRSVPFAPLEIHFGLQNLLFEEVVGKTLQIYTQGVGTMLGLSLGLLSTYQI